MDSVNCSNFYLSLTRRFRRLYRIDFRPFLLTYVCVAVKTFVTLTLSLLKTLKPSLHQFNCTFRRLAFLSLWLNLAYPDDRSLCNRKKWKCCDCWHVYSVYIDTYAIRSLYHCFRVLLRPIQWLFYDHHCTCSQWRPWCFTRTLWQQRWHCWQWLNTRRIAISIVSTGTHSVFKVFFVSLCFTIDSAIVCKWITPLIDNTNDM